MGLLTRDITGTLLRDLQKQVPPSAHMVGADVSTIFLPTSAQGNIHYVTHDVCDPPAGDLKGQFDLTHVRNVLHSAHRSGIEQAIANLAGKPSVVEYVGSVCGLKGCARSSLTDARYVGPGRLAADYGAGHQSRPAEPTPVSKGSHSHHWDHV